MTLDRDALLRTFLAETDESLARMEDNLLALETDPATPEALSEVFRVVHTLKGNAGVFGFDALVALAHRVEDVLDPLRDGRGTIGRALVGLLFEALDALREMLVAASEDRDADPERFAALGEALQRASREAASDNASVRPAARQASGDLASSLDGLRGGTLRVDVEKLDRLVDVAGEVGISRGRVAQLLEEPGTSKAVVLQALREADYLHLELQELVMKLRMVPVGPTLRRYGRTVRDLAESLGKRARLVIEGDEVELDMTVIEHLKDPLTHMIRNALDHGIESPEDRFAAGKDPVGTVTLRTASEAGSILIEVADDGRGLDQERIVARARAQGLLGEHEVPEDERLFGMIFEAGFTTARAVTDLSGRGVGMDVVRRNVEMLRGSVRAASVPGVGTTLTIRMPLTLAVIEGFVVEVGGEIFILPLDSVMETVGLPADLTFDQEGSGVLVLRGRSLGCVRLRRLLAMNGSRLGSGRESVVVARRSGRDVGLVVDALHGEHQTLVKPVPKLLRGLPGIAGSAILGDGRVALILDVGDLLDRHLGPVRGLSRPTRVPGQPLGTTQTQQQTGDGR